MFASPPSLQGHSQPRWRTCLSIFLTTIALEFLLIVCLALHLFGGRSPAAVLMATDSNNGNNGTTTATNITNTSSPPREAEPTQEQFLDAFVKFCHRKLVWFPPDVNSKLMLCPCLPRHLEGLNMNINMSEPAPSWQEVKLDNTYLPPNGHFRPSDCVARHRTAIIVPFRDRDSHLRLFLSHIHPILQRQELDYQIFVVEQAGLDVFNKAMMMNIGFVMASRMYNFDCYIFHDVDMLPESDYNMYTCSEHVRHVGSHCDKWKYKVPYGQIFGGAIALSKAQFEHANGFSNLYYGWGGEDDDMYRRVISNKMKVVRYPASVARYTMIKHKKDKGNPYNVNSGRAWGWRPSQYKKDGLNSLYYEIKKMENRTLYTWILATIPPVPENLKPKKAKNSARKNVPPYVLAFILILLGSMVR